MVPTDRTPSSRSSAATDVGAVGEVVDDMDGGRTLAGEPKRGRPADAAAAAR